MSVKIKDIPGVMIDKKTICYCGIPCSCIPFNEALSQQGEVNIVLNKEKLIKVLQDAHPHIINRMLADAIIANLSELIERD